MSTYPADNKGIEILNKVAAQALDDEDYRKRLIDNPRKVLIGAGLEIPDGVDVVVHQNSSDTIHLVLPSELHRGKHLDVDDVNLRDVVIAIHF